MSRYRERMKLGEGGTQLMCTTASWPSVVDAEEVAGAMGAELSGVNSFLARLTFITSSVGRMVAERGA